MENKSKNIIIRVPESILDEYKTLCEINGYTMSKRLRNYINMEIKEMNKDGKKIK
jgi:predicted DNA-binding protein